MLKGHSANLFQFSISKMKLAGCIFRASGQHLNQKRPRNTQNIVAARCFSCRHTHRNKPAQELHLPLNLTFLLLSSCFTSSACTPSLASSVASTEPPLSKLLHNTAVRECPSWYFFFSSFQRSPPFWQAMLLLALSGVHSLLSAYVY